MCERSPVDAGTSCIIPPIVYITCHISCLICAHGDARGFPRVCRSCGLHRCQPDEKPRRMHDRITVANVRASQDEDSQECRRVCANGVGMSCVCYFRHSSRGKFFAMPDITFVRMKSDISLGGIFTFYSGEWAMYV